MSRLFEEFTKPSYTDWVNQLKKDLKGQSEELIQRKDAIEELCFNSYQHQDSVNTQSSLGFENPYIRGTYARDNRWENLGTIEVKEEKEANTKALTLLNMGVTALRFIIVKDNVDWKTLTEEIQLQYIETTFKINHPKLYFSVLEYFSDEELSTVFFELELSDIKDNEWTGLTQSLKANQRYTFISNGYAVQQCGATTWQEIAYCLSVGHEYLAKLTDHGLTTDEAVACIHFNVGAGATYFYEIAKIRTLRLLWTRIVEEYQPEHACSYNTRITGITGFSNKSLKDPHTNLLRQTTEAMSLAFSGVHAISVQPYDAHSVKGATKLSTRMAVNISLILQEESYLDKVIDPLGGSYTLEYLTNEIAEKAWSLFQQIEASGGISTQESIQLITSSIESTAALRKQRIADKTDSLIGINIFPNPTAEENEWLSFDSYLGLSHLNLEQSI